MNIFNFTPLNPSIYHTDGTQDTKIEKFRKFIWKLKNNK